MDEEDKDITADSSLEIVSETTSMCTDSEDEVQLVHVFGKDAMSDAEFFRVKGKEMVDYIASYLTKDVHERKPFPTVQPGFLKDLLPAEPPQTPTTFEAVMEDVNNAIMPGVMHWHHPNFFGYFVAANSYPGLLGEMLSSGLGCIGFSWASSPACTELEVIMMDWLAKMLGLPEFFLSSSGTGGGVISTTTSDATFVSLLAARNKAVGEIRVETPTMNMPEAMGKLVGYHSEQAHSSVERSGLIAMITMRAVPTDDRRRMRVDILKEMIDQDIKRGLKPFWMCATLGTTNTCAFDNLAEIGPICKEFNIWLHVDAAYAGSAFICPEFRYLMNGIEYADSFVFNAHKWLLVNFDCSCVWYRHSRFVVNAFDVDPVYLKYKHQGKMPDFRHWGVAFGRKFRSLKIWFVVQMYGVIRLQEYIRNHVLMAKAMGACMVADDRFEIVEEIVLGLVCFRLRGSSLLNKEYLEEIYADGRLYLVPGGCGDFFFLRLAVNYQYIDKKSIKSAFNILSEVATKTLEKWKENKEARG